MRQEGETRLCVAVVREELLNLRHGRKIHQCHVGMPLLLGVRVFPGEEAGGTLKERTWAATAASFASGGHSCDHSTSRGSHNDGVHIESGRDMVEVSVVEQMQRTLAKNSASAAILREINAYSRVVRRLVTCCAGHAGADLNLTLHNFPRSAARDRGQAGGTGWAAIRHNGTATGVVCCGAALCVVSGALASGLAVDLLLSSLSAPEGLAARSCAHSPDGVGETTVAVSR